MRDQINGQLYDAWRTDCDVYSDYDPLDYLEFCDATGDLEIARKEDYTHNIIPADEDAVFRNYEDRLAD